jgi:transcriptional regulator with XRE-family HTH domain
MTESLPYDPGAKIARYRKQLKLTAEEVAERAGFGLTRSIVANLENGRKEDLTVRQLVAIAFVLDVSPADLLFDITKPYQHLELTGGDGYVATAPVWLSRDWFGGSIERNSLHASVNGDLLEHSTVHPGFENLLISDVLRRRNTLFTQLLLIEGQLAEAARVADANSHQVDPVYAQQAREAIRDIQSELYTVDNALRANNVDLNGPAAPLPSA